MTLQALDVAIGLTFVYMILSLLCSTLLEMISQFRSMRGRILERGIKNVVGGGDEQAGASMAEEVYAHPLIGALSTKGRLPSYIPPDLFSEAFLDRALAAQGAGAPALNSAIRARLEAASKSTPAAQVALKYFDECGGDLGEVKKRLAGWYSASMDRVSGWYKRWTARWLLGIAALVAITSNTDTIRIIRILSTDEATRTTVVSAAIEQTDQTLPETTKDVREAAKQGLVEIGPLIGWSDAEWANRSRPTWLFIVVKFFGLAMTTISLSLGAPFWFDILQKLARIRSSLKPSPKDASTDTPGDGGEKPADSTKSPTQPASPSAPPQPVPGGGPPPPEDTYTRGMIGFRPHSGGARSDVNAYWLARLCSLAYLDPHARARGECDALGLAIGDHPVSKPGVEAQCLVAGDNSVCVVAFRGTEPTKPADIITDVTFNLVDVPWATGKAHKGFLNYLDAVWDDLLKAIDARRTEGQSLWLTGHSLGGALAVLAAARLMAERPNTVIHGIYTFGQPRIGNADLGAWINARLGPVIHRYVNNRDIVTRVPTRLNGYHDGGSMTYFDERGVLRTNPGFWFRFLDTVAVTPEEVRAKGREGIADHSITAYAELLRIAARISA